MTHFWPFLPGPARMGPLDPFWPETQTCVVQDPRFLAQKSSQKSGQSPRVLPGFWPIPNPDFEPIFEPRSQKMTLRRQNLRFLQNRKISDFDKRSRFCLKNLHFEGQNLRKCKNRIFCDFRARKKNVTVRPKSADFGLVGGLGRPSCVLRT